MGIGVGTGVNVDNIATLVSLFFVCFCSVLLSLIV